MYKQSTVGKIIDSQDEDFLEAIKDESVGYLKSLLNLLRITYEQMVAAKDACIKRYHDSNNEEEKDQITNMLPEFYAEFQKIETKCTLLVKEIDKRKLTLIDNKDI